LLGTVQKHPQIIAIDAEVAANLIFVPFFKKNLPQQAAVFFGQLFENLADLSLQLLRHHGTQNVDVRRGKVLVFFIFQRTVALRRPVMLQQNVVADGVHESSQPLWLTNATLAAQCDENTGKSLLAHVLDGLRRIQTGTQLQLDQFAEISHEMFLDAEISSTKALDVGLIEGLELQGRGPVSAEVPASLAPRPKKIGSEKRTDLALPRFAG
jgi:hypothetical protein